MSEAGEATVNDVVARTVRGHARARLGAETAKRALDITVALAALIVLGPVLAVLAGLVWLTSPGPAFFRQERLGRDERRFTLLKLRTMSVNNDDRIHREYVTSLLSADQTGTTQSDGLFKLSNDPRVTPVGRWLRRTSLDELPQLLNVLSGPMSLVGPRPVLAWEAEMFSETDRQRFAVKPGITGLWQVSGRNELSFREALALDVEYVQRQTFAFDLLILIQTLPSLLKYRAR
jgi:lipopolysaccharide/colanic/teichoic acid biosynthesis glycosyltransferase